MKHNINECIVVNESMLNCEHMHIARFRTKTDIDYLNNPTKGLSDLIYDLKANTRSKSSEDMVKDSLHSDLNKKNFSYVKSNFIKKSSKKISSNTSNLLILNHNNKSNIDYTYTSCSHCDSNNLKVNASYFQFKFDSNKFNKKEKKFNQSSTNLSLFLKDHNSEIFLLNAYFELCPDHRKDFISSLIRDFMNIITQEAGVRFIIELCLQLHDSIELRQFLTNANFLWVSYSINYDKLIQVLTNLSILDLQLVYESFNQYDTWKSLIMDKYGRNVVEFIMRSSQNSTFNHSILFECIEDNFVHFSLLYHSTFVVQTYILLYHRIESFNKILLYITELSYKRNGIFVIIAALRSFEKDLSKTLIDIIVINSLSTCKSCYGSTLMEYVFKNFSYAIDLFIETQITSLLAIIEDIYGNYIIQKLLYNVNAFQKSILINKLLGVVPMIKKGNVRRRWLYIIEKHSTESKDELTIRNSKVDDKGSNASQVDIQNQSIN